MNRAGVYSENLAKRIHIIRGDLTSERFGMSENQYYEIVNKISDIYHSGAWVNMAVPYSGLRNANVKSTICIIQMALASKSKVHYISSVGAIPAISVIKEEYILIDPMQMDKKDGYGQSKAVSERLFYEAHVQLGVDIRVFRPSSISAHTITGFSNQLDFSSLLLRACAIIKGAVFDTTVLLHWIPVDFVAKSIVILSKNSTPKSRRVFHLTTEGPHLRTVLAILKEVGVNMDKITTLDWQKKLSLITESDKLIYPLRDQFKTYEWSTQASTPISTEKTKDDLYKLGLIWPIIDNELIKKNIQYLININFFPK